MIKRIFAGLLATLALGASALTGFAEPVQTEQEVPAEQVQQIVSQMAMTQGVNEQMKATDQMKWVQMMNSLKQSAEEIVLRELVYS